MLLNINAMDITYQPSDESLESSLISAVERGDGKRVEQLIENGAIIDCQSKHWTNSSALHIAVDKMHLSIVSLLLSLGANTEVVDSNGLTPLMLACATENDDGLAIAELLIEKGADPNYVRESDEMTALKFAARRGSENLVKRLCALSDDIDGPVGTKQTALMLAARYNNVRVIKVLLDCGADPNKECGLKWAKGKTALWLAQEEGSKNAVKYLSNL